MPDFFAYLESHEDLATEVGVIASRFWAMTPGELQERVVVYRRWEVREMERAAWMVHHIMSAFLGSKQTPSIDKLLGRVEKG